MHLVNCSDWALSGKHKLSLFVYLLIGAYFICQHKLVFDKVQNYTADIAPLCHATSVMLMITSCSLIRLIDSAIIKAIRVTGPLNTHFHAIFDLCG